MDAPSTNGDNGRDQRGRFAEGNAGGPGNPHNQKIAALRKAMLDAITAKDIREVIDALKREAKAGDVVAARELLDRCLGKSQEAELLRRIEELEEALQKVWGSKRREGA